MGSGHDRTLAIARVVVRGGFQDTRSRRRDKS